MDTRKLSIEESAHEHEMEVQDQHGRRLGAVWLERPDTATGEEMAFGVELVRRWNAFPVLLDRIHDLVQTASRVEDMMDGDKDKQNAWTEELGRLYIAINEATEVTNTLNQ